LSRSSGRIVRGGVFVRAVFPIVVLVLVAAVASGGSRAKAQTAPCIGARIHYEAGPDRDLRRLPWVAAGRSGREIVGYLFYYTPELRSRARLRIFVGGELPSGGSTKILWVVRRPLSSTVTILGRRLDAAGTFRQDERSARGPRGIVFPSVVDVPKPGCWLVTVRNGRRSARFALEAISD
jgi:hypothetical protein